MMSVTIPVQIKLTDLWGETPFQRDAWSPINFLVGPNATGKTRFAEGLKPQLTAKLKPRLLGADRLFGLEKGDIAWGTRTRFSHGINIGESQAVQRQGAEQGHAADAFIILKEKLDVHIRLDALLTTFFQRKLRLAEEGGFLKPKLQRIHGGGAEYDLKNGECHGLKELLALLSFIYDDAFNCLIIDEPEINLHPQFQSFLLSEIRRLAGNPLTQPGKKMFFLITHSPYLLDFRTIDDLRSLLFFQPNQPPRVLGQLSPDDEFRLKKLLPRLNTHHKQFFFASRPIFVEGYRDQQLFTLIQEKRGRVLGVTGACFIDVNGHDEQDLFYRLCQQYGIKGQFICDLDTLTNGRLRDSISTHGELMGELARQGLGADLRDASRTLWTRLDTLAEALEATDDPQSGRLREAVVTANEREKKRYRLLVLLIHEADELRRLLPDQSPQIDCLLGTLTKLRDACGKIGVHLLPRGALENHCLSYRGEPWSITDKAKSACFEEESTHLLSATDAKLVEQRYPTLVPVLDAAQGLASLDLDRHLGNAIGDWIAVVQSAVARKEVTDAATLQTHARVDWKKHNRIFTLISFDARDSGFSCRLRLTNVIDERTRTFEFTEKTVHATFQLPDAPSSIPA